MARGINKVILVGNLGADPEVRSTGGGTAITSIRIATSENWTDKQTGEKKERTEWHRVTMFSKLGEIAAEYLRKGSQVYIEGSLRTSEYEKDGVKRYSTDIIASEMQMLGGRGESGGGGGGSYQRSQGGDNYGGGQSRGGDAPSRQAPAPAPADNGGFDDDDIPF